MGTGKTGKYLKYAIGEIILVVIGILIALQINNWNEQKKIAQKEKDVLATISSDVDANIDEINMLLYNDGFYNLQKILSSIELLINYLESEKPYHDSLKVHFRRSNSYYEVNLKSTAYKSLTSIGIDLVEDIELRTLIGDYFSSTIVQLQKSYVELRDDYYNYMLDYRRHDFIKTFSKESTMTFEAPLNYEELKQKSDYIESLKVFYDVNQGYKNYAHKTLEESIQLKTKIKSYIESL